MWGSLGFDERIRQGGHAFTSQSSPMPNTSRTTNPNLAAPYLVSVDLDVPSSPLVTKLKSFVALARDDIEMVDALCRCPRTYAAEQNLIEEGAAPGFVCIIVSGWAYRYKMLRNGDRQILGFLIPGDICDLSFTLFDRADYSVSALVESRIVKLPIPQLREALSKSRSLRRGLELAAHLDGVILRQWLVNVGQRRAYQKLCHFLYEMTERLRALSKDNQDGWIDFPLNQRTLADTIGTTPVHINRILQQLRREKVIALTRRHLMILDAQKLLTLVNFEGSYLGATNHVE